MPLKVLKVPHGITVITKFLETNAPEVTLRNFAFYNFCENLGFWQLKEVWATLQPIKMTKQIIIYLTRLICL